MIQSSGTPSLKVRDARPGWRSRGAPVALARLAHVVLEHVEEIGAEGGAVGVQRGHPLLGARRRGEGLRDDRLRSFGRPARLRLHLDLHRRHLAGSSYCKDIAAPAPYSKGVLTRRKPMLTITPLAPADRAEW